MELNFVKGHLLTDLARKSKISNEYARKLINPSQDTRVPNTTRAKIFIKAATALNEAVKKGTEKSDKILQQLLDDQN